MGKTVNQNYLLEGMPRPNWYAPQQVGFERDIYMCVIERASETDENPA